MAEVVNEMQERMLPEYEQLKKFEVCTEEQIKDCMRKRQAFHVKITQSEKSLRDYADFIIYERKIHKWISEKERVHGTKMAGLKTNIVQRIIRLYRDGLRQFPHEEAFWYNFLQFSKKSVPNEVAGIYEKMLTFHGDKPVVWCDMALWTYEYTLNMSKVKSILYRGLHRHPESEIIFKTLFDLLIMSTEKNLGDNTTSERDLGLEQVEIVYQSSKHKIVNLSYFLRLLERCEEPGFAEMTAPLQKTIIDDLMLRYACNEQLWHALAQRELRGFSTSDLIGLDRKETISDDNGDALNDSLTEVDRYIKDTKAEASARVWKPRSLKRRIELCCNVYETAVKTLATTEMWTLYINAMLELNRDLSTQQVFKRKSLAIAFKAGHLSGLMSVEHYVTFIRLLLESPGGFQMAETVLTDVIKKHKSVKLYDLLLSACIAENNEPKVYEIFGKANADLGVAQCLPVWHKTIQFYKVQLNNAYEKRLKTLYKRACQQPLPEFGLLRADYLEFCFFTANIDKTRREYDKLSQIPPPSLELHQTMATLESRLVKDQININRWRLCHENAAFYFGKTSEKVWINFIKFERDHGDPKQMPLLYQRAMDTLNAKLLENFLSKYTLLSTTMI